MVEVGSKHEIYKILVPHFTPYSLKLLFFDNQDETVISIILLYTGRLGNAPPALILALFQSKPLIHPKIIRN